jgi:nucleoside-diphosphate-sugar epimerase
MLHHPHDLLRDELLTVALQKEMLEPAVKGTLNVLRAAKDSGVSRVVLVSSQVAMVLNPSWPEDKVIYEGWAAGPTLSTARNFRYISALS